MITKKLILTWLSCLLILTWSEISAADLSGKFVVSAKGGICSALGSGFDSDNSQDGRYALGISAEYFFLEALSAGLTVAHNSFEGKWQKSYYDNWNNNQLGYTGWSWTNVNIFTRFVMGPRSEVSPYIVAGTGLYFHRITDKIFRTPDTLYTHASFGKGELGFYVGFGIQYLLSKSLMVSLEFPLTTILTEGSEYVLMDQSHRIEQNHRIFGKSQWVNILAGISFLW